MLAQTPTAPVGVLGEQMTHLRDLGFADRPALNDGGLEHGRHLKGENSRSPEQNENIFGQPNHSQLRPASLALLDGSNDLNSYKGTRASELTQAQKSSNREKSKTRVRVEHVFGHMTVSMHALYQRCIGFVRNEGCIKMTNLVYNMARFEQIQRLGVA
jgi:hypothetical protein